MNKIIIAIDGHSSCGKSTVAKALARALNYTYIDTGAMYRAITLYFLQQKIDYKNHEAVAEALRQIHLSFIKSDTDDMPQIHLNGINVEDLVRSLEVAGHVSAVAAIPEVRTFAVKQQQEMGRQKGVVMDGRDIGTVVFPNAALKIFVTADPAIRLERRYQELLQTNPTISKEEVAANLQQRDSMDSTREHSPLKQAEDALVLDNTNLDRAQQFELAMQCAMERIN